VNGKYHPASQPEQQKKQPEREFRLLLFIYVETFYGTGLLRLTQVSPDFTPHSA
jgi:hypothetical protein